jgi:ERCC4-type nuclease
MALHMALKIVLDINERSLKDEAAAVGQDVGSQRLPLGDVAFYRGEELVALAERKTLPDLDASILDGRFREQRERLRDLASSEGGPLCFYIVEGCWCSASFHSEGSGKRVRGALENLSLVHRMNIIWTTSVQDTFDTVSRLASKLEQDGSTRRGFIGITKSRGAALKESLFAHMLCVIPGVSPAVAKAIAGQYPSWDSLAVAWSGTITPQALLADIIISGKRRIGSSLSNKIWVAYYGKVSH